MTGQPGTGDPFRAFRGGLYSPHFQTYNRNKQSITLNTKLPEDAAAFDELVRGDRKSTRLNSSHIPLSRMPSSA